MSASYWVMKVIGPSSLVVTRRDLARKVGSGDLCVVGGELCEPIVEFDDQEPAMARALLEHQRSGVVHKVTLSADLPKDLRS